MRICRKCDISKSEDYFDTYTIKGKGKLYRRWTCKVCHARNQRNWERNNKERVKICRRDYYQKIRCKVFMAYGGYICNCCGENENTFLCISHVKEDRFIDRKIKISNNIYRQVIAEDFPRGKYQVLCVNCNQSKMINKGTCAHKLERATTISKESTLQAIGSGSARRPEWVDPKWINSILDDDIVYSA